MEEKREMPRDGQLAMRILNFVMPYIPDHVREECLEIIKNETRKPASIKDTTKHNYAHTTIRWKDDGSEEEAIISLCSMFNEKHDEEIMFYCDSEEDFEHLKEFDNGQDFVVVGCTMFTETLD